MKQGIWCEAQLDNPTGRQARRYRIYVTLGDDGAQRGPVGNATCRNVPTRRHVH